MCVSGGQDHFFSLQFYVQMLADVTSELPGRCAFALVFYGETDKTDQLRIEMFHC